MDDGQWTTTNYEPRTTGQEQLTANDSGLIRLSSLVVRPIKTHPTSRMTRRDKLGIGLARMESRRARHGTTTSPCVRRWIARTVASATCSLVQLTSRVM